MKKIALIDADSLMYYEMGKDTLEEAIDGINTRINHILEQTGAEHYAGFLTIGRCFRYKIAKSKPYKYNRTGASKPPIFYALKAYLQQSPHMFISIDGLEADDAVAIYAAEVKAAGNMPIICSPDKDVLKQIPGTHYNFQKAEMITTSNSEAVVFLWKQTLMGDSTDGIPGIPGLGPKTADKIIDSKPDVLTYAQIVIDKYVEKFGIPDGIHKFVETFNLVYILRTETEALMSYDIKIPTLQLISSELLEYAGNNDEGDGWEEL